MYSISNANITKLLPERTQRRDIANSMCGDQTATLVSKAGQSSGGGEERECVRINPFEKKVNM